MKITYIGLSCYLLENNSGERILIDAFYDRPENALGLKFPNDIQADLFLVSHPDEDHSYMNQKFLRKQRKPDMKDNGGQVRFSGLDLKVSVIREWNGDLNIAYHFTLDGIRFLHLADKAHPLNDDQLKELGRIDVLFMPMPKIRFTGNIDGTLEIIKQINPGIVIPSHYVPPALSDINPSLDEIKEGIRERIMQKWITNPAVNEETVINLTGAYLSALELKIFFPFEDIRSPELNLKKIDKNIIKVIFFRNCLGK